VNLIPNNDLQHVSTHHLKKLKRNKIPGIHNLRREILNALDRYGKDILFRIVTRAYTGILLKDFEKCVIIPLPKKKMPEKSEDCRKISLITHASKILTKIIHTRLESRISGLLAEDQLVSKKTEALERRYYA